MSIKTLVNLHGNDLGRRLDSLSPVQQQAVAEVAYEVGFLAVMEALLVPVASLERCMRACGYEQCTGECEAWFGALELDEQKRCPDCATSDDFAERQAEMKARDEWLAEAYRVLLPIGEKPTAEQTAQLTALREQGESPYDAAMAMHVEEPGTASGN